ncbi:helix-turn-helix transcriptional regulator [Rhizobium sp. Leaf371]|uniref:helix-turn-helix transcriptional regulator n=1 Tax=Rhizobium sp. Leaf371 TaxID=1736355 RepID=UPI000B1A5AC7|nr:helix-turn-helix transcriptional regulator [Rhizobium sp. Leaf371]
MSNQPSKRPQKDAATLARLLARSPSGQGLREAITEKEPSNKEGPTVSIPSMSMRIKGAFNSGSLPMSAVIDSKHIAPSKYGEFPHPTATVLQSSSIAATHIAQDIHTTADLGRLVKKAREEKGLTQQEFADLTGVGRRFVSELENGKPTVEFGKALKVALGAGISLQGRQR